MISIHYVPAGDGSCASEENQSILWTGSWIHDLDNVKVVSYKTLQFYCGHSKYTRNASLDGSLLRYRYPLDGCTLY